MLIFYPVERTSAVFPHILITRRYFGVPRLLFVGYLQHVLGKGTRNVCERQPQHVLRRIWRVSGHNVLEAPAAYLGAFRGGSGVYVHSVLTVPAAGLEGTHSVFWACPWRVLRISAAYFEWVYREEGAICNVRGMTTNSGKNDISS